MAGDGGDGRLEAVVYGRVQGVAFRHHTVRTATRLGLTGWVANAPDGTVHVVAEGDQRNLDALEAWLGEGPPAARVHRVEASRHQAAGAFQDFGVRWGIG